MNPNTLFYEPSGRINPVGLTAAYISGLLVASLLAYLYTLIDSKPDQGKTRVTVDE